jgi:hypothetical protein
MMISVAILAAMSSELYVLGWDIHSKGSGRRTVMVGKDFLNLGLTEGKQRYQKGRVNPRKALDHEFCHGQTPSQTTRNNELQFNQTTILQ